MVRCDSDAASSFAMDVNVATAAPADGERHEVGPGMHAFRHPVA